MIKKIIIIISNQTSVGFSREGKILLEQSREPINATHILCRVQNQIQATLVEAKCSHHWANTAPPIALIDCFTTSLFCFAMVN